MVFTFGDDRLNIILDGDILSPTRTEFVLEFW